MVKSCGKHIRTSMTLKFIISMQLCSRRLRIEILRSLNQSMCSFSFIVHLLVILATRSHLCTGRLIKVHSCTCNILFIAGWVKSSVTATDVKLCYYYNNNFTALWILSGATRVSWYQKKHSLTHTCHGHQSSLICFLHLLWSMASFLFNSRVWQSFCTISIQVFFGLPLGLATSTLYSIHFFTQSLSSLHSTCPCHRYLFCCSTKIMSSNPNLSTLCLELYLLA